MSCNRCENMNKEGQVMGCPCTTKPEIALRGPGCINGTGQCDGVLGTGCIGCDELLDIYCRRCTNVGGTGCPCTSNLLGTGGGRCINYADNVLGTGGRNRCCRNSCNDLTTPCIVPR